MPKKRKEEFERTCEYPSCGKSFWTKNDKAKYCPKGNCRTKAWSEAHPRLDVETQQREILRKYWREQKRSQKAARQAQAV